LECEFSSTEWKIGAAGVSPESIVDGQWWKARPSRYDAGAPLQERGRRLCRARTRWAACARPPEIFPPVGVKNAARIEAETREPESKPEPDPLPVPGSEAERPAAPATDTVPTAPTDTADDETEPDEEEDLEPTSEETLTNAIESVGLLLDTLFDEEIINELAEVDLDKRDAFFSRLRAEFNKRMDAIERMPVLDKADAIAALPESVKAYFRMHGRVSNCDVRWYMNRFPALNDNKLEDSERRAIADKLIRDMLQRGELIKVKRKRDVYEIATETAPSAVEVA
jgi:hypothetical protein